MVKPKGKKGPKSKKSKNSIDLSQYPEGTTEIDNPNFHFGCDGFKLENGDCYVGGFCAHKIGIAWREGNGIYITKDDHSYEGVWENDQLLSSEETIIKYPDGVEYRGPIKHGKYSGKGTYILDKKTPINCYFQDNTPVGEVVLTDPQNNLWKGNVEEDYVLLRPENHFYINLSYDRGIGKKVPLKKSEDEIPKDESVKSDKSDLDKLEKIIFKKSSKTVNDFEDTLLDKNTIKSYQSESKLKITKTKSSLNATRSRSNVSLLKTFLSPEYRNSCPPVSVYSPTVDMEKE